MTAPGYLGDNMWVNLQTSMGKDSGAHHGSHRLCNLWHPFCYKFLSMLLTIVPATNALLFIYSSVINL